MNAIDNREFLALSFEAVEEGYVYYQHRWSRGIPVTAEERDAYLAIPVWKSRRSWMQGIAGRDTVPPRAHKPLRNKMLSMMPLSTAISSAVIGGVFVVRGGFHFETIGAIAQTVGGLIAIAFALRVFFAKWIVARSAPTT